MIRDSVFLIKMCKDLGVSGDRDLIPLHPFAIELERQLLKRFTWYVGHCFEIASVENCYLLVTLTVSVILSATVYVSASLTRLWRTLTLSEARLLSWTQDTGTPSRPGSAPPPSPSSTTSSARSSSRNSISTTPALRYRRTSLLPLRRLP